MLKDYFCSESTNFNEKIREELCPYKTTNLVQTSGNLEQGRSSNPKSRKQNLNLILMKKK